MVNRLYLRRIPARRVGWAALVGIVAIAPIALSACGNASQTTDSTAQTSPGVMPHEHMHDQMHGNMDHGMMHMDMGPADAEFDLRFIDGMILHHQGAVNMAEEALEKSERAEIRQLSQEIIAAQEQEIAQMQAWRQAWYTDAPDEPIMFSADMGHTMPMTPEMQAAMQMDMDLGPADAEFDLRFINAMIPHHEGALVMAEEALEKSQRPEIRQLSEEIITSQQTEIEQMQQWRADWYGQ